MEWTIPQAYLVAKIAIVAAVVAVAGAMGLWQAFRLKFSGRAPEASSRETESKR